MLTFLSWTAHRIYCFVRGHRMASDRIYDPMGKAVTPGYACERCGKTQRLLYRWQSLDFESSEDGDAESE